MSDSDTVENQADQLEDESKENKQVMPKGSILDRDVDLNRSPDEAQAAEFDALKVECQENYDKYLRALADLDNYKKRVMKERAELLKYQGERIFIDVLDVYDDLERALQHSESDLSQLRTGLEMIHKRFTDVLGKWEVRGESSVGKSFDPNLHNALSKVPASGDAEPGSVIGELKKVFFYKDKVLRHAEVVVAEGDTAKP